MKHIVSIARKIRERTLSHSEKVTAERVLAEYLAQTGKTKEQLADELRFILDAQDAISELKQLGDRMHTEMKSLSANIQEPAYSHIIETVEEQLQESLRAVQGSTVNGITSMFIQQQINALS